MALLVALFAYLAFVIFVRRARHCLGGTLPSITTGTFLDFCCPHRAVLSGTSTVSAWAVSLAVTIGLLVGFGLSGLVHWGAGIASVMFAFMLVDGLRLVTLAITVPGETSPDATEMPDMVYALVCAPERELAVRANIPPKSELFRGVVPGVVLWEPQIGSLGEEEAFLLPRSFMEATASIIGELHKTHAADMKALTEARQARDIADQHAASLSADLEAARSANVQLDNALHNIRLRRSYVLAPGAPHSAPPAHHDYGRMSAEERAAVRARLMDDLRRLGEIEQAAAMSRISPRLPL